jgi:hypothetical protein
VKSIVAGPPPGNGACSPSDAIPADSAVVIDGDGELTKYLKAIGRGAGWHDVQYLAWASLADTKPEVVDLTTLRAAMKSVLVNADNLVYRLGQLQAKKLFWTLDGARWPLKRNTAKNRAK